MTIWILHTIVYLILVISDAMHMEPYQLNVIIDIISAMILKQLNDT